MGARRLVRQAIPIAWPLAGICAIAVHVVANTALRRPHLTDEQVSVVTGPHGLASSAATVIGEVAPFSSVSSRSSSARRC